MRVNELRNKSVQDLKGMVLELKKELMNLRFQKQAQQLTNTARVREARRTIARIKTVLQDQR